MRVMLMMMMKKVKEGEEEKQTEGESSRQGKISREETTRTRLPATQTAPAKANRITC
jgi:hypothetical protein